MSVDQEAEICRDFRHAWQVRTDHYLIRTNYSLERGVEIAKTLEQFHDFFMQTFAAFFSTPDQMLKLFQTSAPDSDLQSRARPYRVDYFRTREEYVQRLIKKVPQIRITNGLYFTADRVAYFYYDPQQQNQDTLFHEATHQLFYEKRPPRPHDRHGRELLGRRRDRLLHGVVPSRRGNRSSAIRSTCGSRRPVTASSSTTITFRWTVCRDGNEPRSTSREISKNYSQAAGLAHFFMQYEAGRYRDA